MGAEFDNQVAKWGNSITSLSVEKRSGDLDEMKVFFAHTALNEAFSKSLESTRGPPKL